MPEHFSSPINDIVKVQSWPEPFVRQHTQNSFKLRACSALARAETSPEKEPVVPLTQAVPFCFLKQTVQEQRGEKNPTEVTDVINQFTDVILAEHPSNWR